MRMLARLDHQGLQARLGQDQGQRGAGDAAPYDNDVVVLHNSPWVRSEPTYVLFRAAVRQLAHRPPHDRSPGGARARARAASGREVFVSPSSGTSEFAAGAA